jgi:hypothetical protein
MDQKINDVNEMIENNIHDDDVRDGNNCNSNRSTPTSVDKEKTQNNNRQHGDDDDDDANDENDDDNASEHNSSSNKQRDNGDRCSVNSSMNVNSNSTRTMAEELALKDKEVSFLSCN